MVRAGANLGIRVMGCTALDSFEDDRQGAICNDRPDGPGRSLDSSVRTDWAAANERQLRVVYSLVQASHAVSPDALSPLRRSSSG